MSVYYKDDFVTLYYGDCLTEHWEWTEADVLVTDPPYGMSYVDRQGSSIANDESLDARNGALAAWASEQDAWGDDRPAIVFGTWKVERPSGTRQVIIWDKSGGGGTVGSPASPWAYSHEEIYILGSWPKLPPGGRRREGGEPSRESGVLRAANFNTRKNAGRPDHPTPKPVGLMEMLIAKCPPGVIADPFAGSGATLVAAKNLRRQVVGVELEERYCEIIAKRLAQDVFDFGMTA